MILTELTTWIFRPGKDLSKSTLDPGIRVIDKIYGDLYQEGERLNELFFLIQGKVVLTKKNEWGKRVRLLSIGKGCFLGLQSLQNANISSHSAKVCQPSRLLIIPLLSLPDFIGRWPLLRQQIMSQLIHHIDLAHSY
ncbi:MAG: cyclic nucleotide-binding domain-containing protein [Roseivirga sp.]|nr:cyclic nucleotide-binding domain-containing protein [Roseivirga sp.]